jgi:3',5'-cyclic AMP phosphodiesterase CpdA
MGKTIKTIFHLSDIHIGETGVSLGDFREVIEGIEKRSPHMTSPLILITGDLTGEGLREEYEAFADVIKGIETPLVMIPGNHDERNYGAAHFEELFGERFKTYEDESIAVYAADSAEPDNDAGHVGRVKYNEIHDYLGAAKEKVRIFALHHHLIPVPNTGREHNVVEDSGAVLGLLDRVQCSLVLSGHRHVPWMWNLNDMIVYTTGTLLSRRVRGATTQVHTLIELSKTDVTFTLVETSGSASLFSRAELRPDVLG